MKRFFTWILLLSLFFASPGLCTDNGDSGTLIVTYQTGPEGERLDRVRFWIANDKNERHLYPRGCAYVDDHETKTRMVVIEDLQPGTYHLKFLVPNTDSYFDRIPSREFTVTARNVVKIDQKIKPRLSSGKPEDNSATQESLANTPTEIEHVAQISHPYFYNNYPYYNTYPYYYDTDATLTIKSNMDAGKWTLYDGHTKIQSGGGSSTSIKLRPSSTYSVVAEKIPGYTVEVRPTGVFQLLSNDYFSVDLYYSRSSGYIEIRNTLPKGMELNGQITSDADGKVIPFTVGGEGKSLIWKSSELYEGSYTVTYSLPNTYQPYSPEQVQVTERKLTVLAPKFIALGQLKVSTNSSEAIYLLKPESGDQFWRGQGAEFTFSALPKGYYTLQFSTSTPNYYTPPAPKKVYVGQSQTMQIRAKYDTSGRVSIAGNIERFHLSIKELGGQRRSFEETITNGHGEIALPQGTYRITADPLNSFSGIPEPVDVRIRSLQTAQVNIKFPTKNSGEQQETLPFNDNTTPKSENQSTLVITSNLPTFSAMINETGTDNTNAQEGKELSIPMEVGKTYTVTFTEQEGYATPNPRTVTFDKPEKEKISVFYAPATVMLPVTGSDDKHFSVSAYEITNEEFAFWLNRAYKSGLITYHTQGELLGTVTDKEGHPLCKTLEGDLHSQITAYGQQITIISFRPLPDRNAHPVILVSWYGASLFCQENGGRLPTEEEWEMAAGKERLYGFDSDKIDPTWANYRLPDEPENRVRVLTKDVGFYDGKNLLPLSARAPHQELTHDAKSQFGAYDMSGNVREWTSSGEKEKIVKGGSYNSLPEDVQIQAKSQLAPETMDFTTGFRIVKD